MAEYIKKVDESTRQAIKNKSAFSLPTRPSEAGMKPDAIKRTFYQPIVDMTQSSLGEIDRVVEETNTALNEISAEVLQNAKKYSDSKDTEVLQNAKEYTDTKINNFQIFEIVNQLPATGDKNKLYLLIKDGEAGDLYGEYLYTDSGWEFIGEMSVKSGTIVYVNGVQQSVLYFSRNPQEEIDSINDDIQGISTNLQNATDDIQNISADLQDTVERLTETENDIVGLNTEIANKTVVKVGGVAQSEIDAEDLAISFVEDLPEITQEEFNKHRLYLYNGNLSFMNKYYANDTFLYEDKLPYTLNGAMIAQIEDKAYILGGNASGTTTNKILEYNSKNNEIVTLSATLPSNIKESIAFAIGYDIYVFINNILHKFNINTKTVTSLGVSVLYAAKACCACVNDIAYIFKTNGEVTKFNPIDGTLTTISSNYKSIKNASAVAIGTNIYIFGGIIGSDLQDSIIKFDTITNEITTLTAKLPFAIQYSTSIVLDNCAYIFGGYSSVSPTTKNSIIKFDSSLYEATLLEQSLPIRTERAVSAVFNNTAIIFGGYDNDNNIFYSNAQRYVIKDSYTYQKIITEVL